MKLISETHHDHSISFFLTNTHFCFQGKVMKTLELKKPDELEREKQAIVNKLWDYVLSRQDIPFYMNARLTFQKLECVNECFASISNAQEIKNVLKQIYDRAAELEWETSYTGEHLPAGELGVLIYNLRRSYDSDFNKTHLLHPAEVRIMNEQTPFNYGNEIMLP